MNEEYIKEEHRFNQEIVDKFNLKVGSKITIKDHSFGVKEVEITWINPHYHWFGSEQGWILPDDIIAINGIDVQEEIRKLREIKEQNQAKSSATYFAKG